MGKAVTAAFPKGQAIAFVRETLQAVWAVGDQGHAFEAAALQGRVYRLQKAGVQIGKRVLIAPNIGKHARRFQAVQPQIPPWYI